MSCKHEWVYMADAGGGSNKECKHCGLPWMHSDSRSPNCVDIYASWYGETERICALPKRQRLAAVGQLLTMIYAKDQE